MDTPRRSSVANAGGRPFCQELGIGWVHIGQWIFSISALSHVLMYYMFHVDLSPLGGILDPLKSDLGPKYPFRAIGHTGLVRKIWRFWW